MGKGKDKLLEKVRKCLVVWRCYACGHELIERPQDTFEGCPNCGAKGMHFLFSDDREGLVKLASSK